jgi:hypothetical protein
MSQTYYAGWAGNVSVAGIDWNITKWNGTETQDFLETTNTSNFDSGSNRTYQSGIGGVTKFQFSFTANYDGTNRPESAIRPGTTATFVLQRGGGHTISGNCYIESLDDEQNGIDGVMMWTAQARSVGVFTHA